VVALMPAAHQFYVYLHWPTHNPDIETNIATDRVKALFIALIGLGSGWLFIRIGSHFKSRPKENIR
jgi:hypothetical protein